MDHCKGIALEFSTSALPWSLETASFDGCDMAKRKWSVGYDEDLDLSKLPEQMDCLCLFYTKLQGTMCGQAPESLSVLQLAGSSLIVEEKQHDRLKIYE